MGSFAFSGRIKAISGAGVSQLTTAHWSAFQFVLSYCCSVNTAATGLWTYVFKFGQKAVNWNLKWASLLQICIYICAFWSVIVKSIAFSSVKKSIKWLHHDKDKLAEISHFFWPFPSKQAYSHKKIRAWAILLVAQEVKKLMHWMLCYWKSFQRAIVTIQRIWAQGRIFFAN